MVCSITRGPAKPISAPGSAILRSPSMAKLAVTPPVVGSVITEMYGTFASSSFASAAETLASCIKLIVPSIMRAPPEQETTTSGCRVSMANSIPRVTFSPTTAPIEPPIKLNSIAQQTIGRPLSCPSAVIIASHIPSFFRASRKRDAYGFVSTNRSGSVDVMRASCSVHRPSSSISSRCFAPILKWNWHFGHTSKFASRSLRNTIVRQDSHFTHKPSVRTRRSSGGVGCSIDFLSRLNQAMRSFQRSVFRCSFRRFPSSSPKSRASVIDSPLRQYTLRIRVFHLAHLRHQVRQFHQLGMRIPARADNVHALRPLPQRLHHLVRVQHLVADGVVDFIQHHQIVLAAINRVASRAPALLRHLDVFRIRLRPAHFHEASPHRPNLKLIVAQHLGRIQFPVVPRPFDELHHQHAKPLAHRANRRAQCARRLAFAWPGVNNQQSFFFRHRHPPTHGRKNESIKVWGFPQQTST